MIPSLLGQKFLDTDRARKKKTSKGYEIKVRSIS